MFDATAIVFSPVLTTESPGDLTAKFLSPEYFVLVYISVSDQLTLFLLIIFIMFLIAN